MTHVEVILASGSRQTFQDVDADEFRQGELTLTPTAGGEPVRVFPRGSWREATAYDEPGGYPLYSFEMQVALKFSAEQEGTGIRVHANGQYDRFELSEDGTLTVWFTQPDGQPAAHRYRHVERLSVRGLRHDYAPR